MRDLSQATWRLKMLHLGYHIGSLRGTELLHCCKNFDSACEHLCQAPFLRFRQSSPRYLTSDRLLLRELLFRIHGTIYRSYSYHVSLHMDMKSDAAASMSRIRVWYSFDLCFLSRRRLRPFWRYPQLSSSFDPFFTRLTFSRKATYSESA